MATRGLTEVHLPTRREYEEALEEMSVGIEKILVLALRLAHLVCKNEEDRLPASRPPTTADLGLLYSARKRMKLDVDELQESYELLGRALEALYELELTREVGEWGQATAGPDA